jgi:hypothetical protein
MYAFTTPEGARLIRSGANKRGYARKPIVNNAIDLIFFILAFYRIPATGINSFVRTFLLDRRSAYNFAALDFWLRFLASQNSFFNF